MLYLKKVLILFLATLMILTTFAACSEGNETESTEESSSSTESTETESTEESSGSTESTETESTDSSQESMTSDADTDESTDENETTSISEDDTDVVPEPGSVLDGVTFNNEVLEVFSWTPTNVVEYVEELTDTSTIVDQAVFNRCDYAETRLNVTTRWKFYPMLPEYDPGFVEEIDRENQNGGKYDLVVNVSTFAHSLTTRGVYSNLNRYQYLDFEHEAWSQSLIEDVTLGDKLYFATGDISTNLIFMTSVVFFNKDLVEDLTINDKIKANWDCDNLYELVRSGRWTLDKMLTLCENVYLDKSDDGMKNTGDRYGLNTYGVLVNNFYYGGGYVTVLSDGNNVSISPDFFNPTLVGGILATVNEFLHDTNDAIFMGNDIASVQAEFSAGNVLFSLAPASHAYKKYSNVEGLNYSVLPVPKHSESQAAYACTQSYPYSMYGVASQSKNAEATAAFMQALAEESYEVTRPALFDKLMKGRYAEDPEDAEMWEYAVDANVFDVGILFSGAFGTENGPKLTTTLFNQHISDDNDNWSNVLTEHAVALATYAAGLATEIRALPD